MRQAQAQARCAGLVAVSGGRPVVPHRRQQRPVSFELRCFAASCAVLMWMAGRLHA